MSNITSQYNIYKSCFFVSIFYALLHRTCIDMVVWFENVIIKTFIKYTHSVITDMESSTFPAWRTTWVD